MNVEQLTKDARTLVENGDTPNIARAITLVVRDTLSRIAGTYTARAERLWCDEVARFERATR